MTSLVLRALGPRLGAAAVLVVSGLALPGCQSEAPPSDYVARVGDHYLTSSALDQRLDGLGPVRDSAAARAQVVDQWVRRTLLYREAERRNLASVDAVQRTLERQRRSVLVTALRDRLYEEPPLRPTRSEVRTYFERHKEALRLREPHVRVRYLSASRRADAQAARATLQDLSPTADSAWAEVLRAHAADSAQAQRLSRRPFPESRLRQKLPFFAEALGALQEGDTAPVVAAGEQFHVLRLDQRRAAGTAPELAWVAPQIRRRLRIRARKQIYANEVERLRSKAQASGVLDIP